MTGGPYTLYNNINPSSDQPVLTSLAQRISQLVEKKKEVCGESNSGESSVKGVGALVLEG